MFAARPLTLDDIRSTLATRHLGQRLSVLSQVPSTNSELMLLAQTGAEHGSVLVAESQTAGRGRRQSRTWYSPPGTNVYASILVRPIDLTIRISDWLNWIPLTTAIAVTESIQQVTGLRLALKWPNDLLLRGRKVGGILCESGTEPAKQPFVVIGLGLNVNTPADMFPPELAAIAGSLIDDTRQPVDRNRLLAQFLTDLEHALDELASEGPGRLHHAYTSCCATIGKRVRVSVSESREWIGEAVGIGPDGALHVRPDGTSPQSGCQPIVEVRAADVVHLESSKSH